MGQRTITSAARVAGVTVVAMLLALGVAAVVATLLTLAVATIMAVMLMLVGGPALATGRSPSEGFKFVGAVKEATFDE